MCEQECRGPRAPEDDVRHPVTRVTAGCELPGGCWELKSAGPSTGAVTMLNASPAPPGLELAVWTRLVPPSASTIVDVIGMDHHTQLR